MCQGCIPDELKLLRLIDILTCYLNSRTFVSLSSCFLHSPTYVLQAIECVLLTWQSHIDQKIRGSVISCFFFTKLIPFMLVELFKNEVDRVLDFCLSNIF